MKKIICLALIVLVLVCVVPSKVKANNMFVYDEAEVLSQDTEQYIEDLNVNVLSKYSNSPRFVLMMIDHMPEDIDNYALSVFYEYEMSKSENGYDVLLIMATEDRTYKIEAGGGYKEGTLIEQDLTICMMGETVKSNLQLKHYDKAVMEIVQYYEQMMEKQYNGTYNQLEAERAKRMAILKPVCITLFVIGGACCIAHFVITEKKKEKSTNTESHEKPVDTHDKT